MPQRVRLPDQNKPITLVVRNTANNAILHNVTTNDDEVTLSDGLGLQNFYYDATNSQGKTSRRVIDNVTRILQSKNHIGRSVADGNTSNHIEAIGVCAARNFTFVGTVFNGVETDAQLTAFAAAPFDHTVAPPGGVYEFPYDEVVRTAYLTSPSNLANRVSLRVSINLVLDNTKLNDGVTRTRFYSLLDCNMRPDGVTPSVRPTFPVAQGMIPSYASTNVESFADELDIAFFKRYYPAFNDGTILCAGNATSNAAEAELVSYTTDANGNIDGESKGDFNIAMTNGFRTTFPEYAFVDNNTIANNDLSTSVLAQKWHAYLAFTMARFELNRIARIKAAVPQLTRTKFWQKDVGSFVDDQARRRRTLNYFYNQPKEIMVVKSNDNSNQSEAEIRFALDDLCSIARVHGAIAIAEPSPPGGGGGDPFDDPVNMAYVNTEVSIMKEFGVGLSYVSHRPDIMDSIRFATNFQQFASPKYNAQFKEISGNDKLVRSNTNFSTILVSGIAAKKTNYTNIKTAQSVTRADIVTIDDIIVTPVISTTTTTTSTSTTTSGGPTTTTTSTSTTTVFIPDNNIEPGLTSAVVGNRTYRIQNGRDFLISILPDGNVRLDYPEFKNASSGGKLCKGWLLKDYEEAVIDSEKNSLRSPTGLNLPNDVYTFYIYYAATDVAFTVDDLQNQVWTLFGNPDTREQNSAQMETAWLEITTNS